MEKENKIVGYVFVVDNGEAEGDGKIRVLGYDRSVSPPVIDLLVWDEGIDFDAICIYWFDTLSALQDFYAGSWSQKLSYQAVECMTEGRLVPVNVEKNYDQKKVYII